MKKSGRGELCGETSGDALRASLVIGGVSDPDGTNGRPTARRDEVLRSKNLFSGCERVMNEDVKKKYSVEPKKRSVLALDLW
jgi:hypothetical protein